MKKALLILLSIILAACSRHVEITPVKLKQELPLWQVLQYRETGSNELKYEDDWFRYDAKVLYLTAESVANMNMVFGMCPVERIEYRVFDKDTQTLVRQETVGQPECGNCHRR